MSRVKRNYMKFCNHKHNGYIIKLNLLRKRETRAKNILTGRDYNTPSDKRDGQTSRILQVKHQQNISLIKKADTARPRKRQTSPAENTPQTMFSTAAA
ncbi:hypothetical protein ElyMa_000709500 [Elysia marginata]|uniref:Uncharacterized protein n=1 Tax=Elysia marginata TaxID=1093978 RepID=A0AAV4GLT9_9GAST|nr:hypothetical protein ElyMa_000709500 [Elysia marginata]